MSASGAGKSPKNRRITCGPSISSSRRRRKQKIFGRPNHETQRCCPTKPDSGFFVPSSRDRESRCWPPCGPVCRVRPQGGERTRPRPPRPEFGPVSGQLKTAKDGQQKGCERKAGERVGAENRRLPRATAPGRAGRFGISPWGQFWLFSGSDFAPWSQSWGQNNENFPAVSHFPRRHRRGQRKDERLWKKKKT